MSDPAYAVDVSYFQTFGFIVLRQFFEPRPLAEEIDQTVNDGLLWSRDVSQYGEIRFQYVPMMSATTPASLALLDRTALVASTLLGSAVIPTRAKGVRYFGNTRGTLIRSSRWKASALPHTLNRLDLRMEHCA